MVHAAAIMVLEVVLIGFHEFIFVDVGFVQVFVVNTEIVHHFNDLFCSRIKKVNEYIKCFNLIAYTLEI